MATAHEPTHWDITVGTILAQIRTHIESLASDDGTYELVCEQTGERLAPIDGFRFEDCETAEAAAHAARKYRPAFWRYDLNAPCYDLIVSEHDSRSGFGGATATVESRTTAGAMPGLPEPSRDLGTDASGRTECAADGDHLERVKLYRRVVVAVSEMLVGVDHQVVETTVMSTYFDLVETMSGTNDLCLCLPESMATALRVHLTSVEWADVLERTASNLTSRPDATKTLAATLAEMKRLDLAESYTYSAWRSGPDAMTRATELALKDHALLAREGRFPVLPVVLELYRRTPS